MKHDLVYQAFFEVSYTSLIFFKVVIIMIFSPFNYNPNCPLLFLWNFFITMSPLISYFLTNNHDFAYVNNKFDSSLRFKNNNYDIFLFFPF